MCDDEITVSHEQIIDYTTFCVPIINSIMRKVQVQLCGTGLSHLLLLLFKLNLFVISAVVRVFLC